MGKKMMHIGLEPGAVGRYVFLPGSPERTEKRGNPFLTLCGVDDENDLIVSGNLSQFLAPPFGLMAHTSFV